MIMHEFQKLDRNLGKSSSFVFQNRSGKYEKKEFRGTTLKDEKVRSILNYQTEH